MFQWFNFVDLVPLDIVVLFISKPDRNRIKKLKKKKVGISKKRTNEQTKQLMEIAIQEIDAAKKKKKTEK